MFSVLKKKLKSWVQKVKGSGEEPKKVKIKKVKVKLEEKEVPATKPPVEATETPEGKKQEQVREAKQELQEILEPEKKSKFSFFKKKLSNEKFDELFHELETALFQNNVAMEVVDSIKLSLGEKLIGKNPSEINLEHELKKSMESVLVNPPNVVDEIKKTLETKKPYVILFIGINGSGKTTTIAKFAHFLKKQNLTCCLAAADTFRAASIEQLQKHAEKLKVPIIKKDYGTDPSSVGFDAISYAKKHNIDVVLIDTAGRMQNKDSLMREMEKISRVNRPDMRIFVGESITGNDATEQASAFNDAIGITGIILSKADVDEKGGTAISVSHVTKKPILFLGTGQNYDDLEVFDKEKLIEKIGL